MPKFTVKLITTTVVEADSKEAVFAEALEAVSHMVPAPEIVITRFKTTKKAVDTRTAFLFSGDNA